MSDLGMNDPRELPEPLRQFAEEAIKNADPAATFSEFGIDAGDARAFAQFNGPLVVEHAPDGLSHAEHVGFAYWYGMALGLRLSRRFEDGSS